MTPPTEEELETMASYYYLLGKLEADARRKNPRFADQLVRERADVYRVLAHWAERLSP